MAGNRDIVERTFEFAVNITKLCEKLDKMAGVARTLSKQVLRAATSIGANVEEAQAGQSKADFISKYSIALKEARETNYWLRLLAAADIVSKTQLDSLRNESNQIARIIARIVINAKKKL